MRKSLVMSLFLGILVLGITFVYASMTSTSPTSGNKVNYDVELRLEQGWNLVVGIPILGSESTIALDSEIKEENIGAIYYYSRSENKYLQMYPNSNEIETYLITAQQNSEEINYFSQSSVWLYSDKAGTMKYSRSDFPNGVNPSLSTGWNFIGISPQFMMKKLKDFKGTCDIEKVAAWGNNQFMVIKPGDVLNDMPTFGDLILADNAQDFGRGILFKVSSDCQLNFGSSGSTVNPPQVPN